MQAETLADVLEWTRSVHHKLAACLAQCSAGSRSERIKMLTGYLAAHERELDRVVGISQEDADAKALNTWVYDYFENPQITLGAACDDTFSDKTSADVLDAVMALDAQIIDLYTYLSGRADVPSTVALIDGLLSLERHEAMLMQHQSRRLDDL